MIGREAFERALLERLPRMRRFAISLTGTVAEGDDLVQSACERAWRRRRSLRDPERLDSWLFQIVRHVWIDQRRGPEARVEPEDPVTLQDLAGGDAERELEARLSLDQVFTAMLDLPAEQRAVLLLVGAEGYAYREAAAILDIPIGTVMSRLARAREALGRMLQAPAEPVERSLHDGRPDRKAGT